MCSPIDPAFAFFLSGSSAIKSDEPLARQIFRLAPFHEKATAIQKLAIVHDIIALFTNLNISLIVQTIEKITFRKEAFTNKAGKNQRTSRMMIVYASSTSIRISSGTFILMRSLIAFSSASKSITRL